MTYKEMKPNLSYRVTCGNAEFNQWDLICKLTDEFPYEEKPGLMNFKRGRWLDEADVPDNIFDGAEIEPATEYGYYRGELVYLNKLHVWKSGDKTMEKTSLLIKRLRECADWADRNIWDVPIDLPDILREAADMLADEEGSSKG